MNKQRNLQVCASLAFLTAIAISVQHPAAFAQASPKAVTAPASPTISMKRRANATKPRVVITADPELDDNNTIIRAILYSSDVKFEGLVYVSSQFHWTGDGKGTTQFIAGREYSRMGLCPCTSWRFSPDERFIDQIVNAYAQVWPNLKVHDPDYPSPGRSQSKNQVGKRQISMAISRTIRMGRT